MVFTPVFRHLLFKRLQFKGWQRRMSGCIHFVCDDSTQFRVSHVAGNADPRAGGDGANVQISVATFFVGRHVSPVAESEVSCPPAIRQVGTLRRGISRCSVTAFTADSGRQADV